MVSSQTQKKPKHVINSSKLTCNKFIQIVGILLLVLKTEKEISQNFRVFLGLDFSESNILLAQNSEEANNYDR